MPSDNESCTKSDIILFRDSKLLDDKFSPRSATKFDEETSEHFAEEEDDDTGMVADEEATAALAGGADENQSEGEVVLTNP